jgi:hypothetical protein
VARYQYTALASSNQTRYVVVWAAHWQLASVDRIAPRADAYLVLTSVLERCAQDGWLAESAPEFGFVFSRRAEDRMLVMVTDRDPHSGPARYFTPFRDPKPDGQ